MFGLEEMATSLGFAPWMVVAFVIIMIWSGIWKFTALWKSARNNSLPWFIILALVNTMGILEILYIFVFSKMKCCNLEISKTTEIKPKRKRK